LAHFGQDQIVVAHEICTWQGGVGIIGQHAGVDG
jgi:hypothetical protein